VSVVQRFYTSTKYESSGGPGAGFGGRSADGCVFPLEWLAASPGGTGQPGGSFTRAHPAVYPNINARRRVASSAALKCNHVPPRWPQVRLPTVMVPTQRLSITDDRRAAPRPRVHVIHLRGRFTAATPREKGCRFTATTSAVHNRVSRPKAIATPRILAREESRTATRQRSSKQNQTNDDHGQQGDLRAHPIPQSRQDRIRHGLSVHRSARGRAANRRDRRRLFHNRMDGNTALVLGRSYRRKAAQRHTAGKRHNVALSQPNDRWPSTPQEVEYGGSYKELRSPS
jgi:hypothetical protein